MSRVNLEIILRGVRDCFPAAVMMFRAVSLRPFCCRFGLEYRSLGLKKRRRTGLEGTATVITIV